MSDEKQAALDAIKGLYGPAHDRELLDAIDHATSVGVTRRELGTVFSGWPRGQYGDSSKAVVSDRVKRLRARVEKWEADNG